MTTTEFRAGAPLPTRAHAGKRFKERPRNVTVSETLAHKIKVSREAA